MSASALADMGRLSLQSRPDELAGTHTSSRVAAVDTPQKGRGQTVEVALAVRVGLVVAAGRIQAFLDELLQEAGDASFPIPRGLLKTRLHRWGNPPRVDFRLARHARHGSAKGRGKQR